MRTPYDLYRPVRVSDGKGGFTEDYDEPQTIWGAISVYENETQIHVDIREDVKVNDVIEVDEED